MKRFGALIVALSLLVSAGTASAEEEPWDHDYFLERSYFVVYPLFLLGGEKTLPIIVEGDLGVLGITPIIVAQNFVEKVSKDVSPELSAGLKLRLFRDFGQ